MLNILSIVTYTYLPPKSGGHYGIFYPQKYLGQHGHLFIAGMKNNAPTSEIKATFFPIFGSSALRYANPYYLFKLANIIRKHQIDVLYLDHPYLFWMAYILCQWFKKPLVIRSHNVEYLRFKNLGKWWWPLLQWYETRSHRYATVVTCVTKEEKEIIKNDVGIANDHIIDIPYGTELASYPTDHESCKEWLVRHHQLETNTKIILFNGSLSYGPNRFGLDKILNVINPALQEQTIPYKIIICGNKLPAEYNNLEAYRNQHILFAGFVEDVSVYFKGADLFLNPVIGGGGIKTKLVEALAFNTESVSTADGATGLYPEYTGSMLHIIPDTDWQGFTDCVIKCLQQSERKNMPQSFYDYYNWDGNMKALVSCLETKV